MMNNEQSPQLHKHSVMWRILFILACACVWSISYQIVQLMPKFFQYSLLQFVGWCSCFVYLRIFR